MINFSNKNLLTIIVSGIVMLLLDFVYLSSTSHFFNDVVKGIQGRKIRFNMIGAIICYPLLLLGLNYFVLLNKKLSKKQKLIDALILGLVIYGVFETTNLAIFDNWLKEAVIIDTVWGGLLFTLTTIITLKLVR